MLYSALLLLLVLDCLALMLVVLLQSGKGGGLAASFGGASSSTDSFMGGRQAATALTKGTWIGGGIFLFLALVLAVLSARPSAAPQSILRQGGPQNALPEAPPSLLEAPLPGDSGAASDSGAANDSGAAADTGTATADTGAVAGSASGAPTSPDSTDGG